MREEKEVGITGRHLGGAGDQMLVPMTPTAFTRQPRHQEESVIDPHMFPTEESQSGPCPRSRTSSGNQAPRRSSDALPHSQSLPAQAQQSRGGFR